MNSIRFILTAFAITFVLASCSDDDALTPASSTDELSFPADTLCLDTVIAGVPSATYMFTIHNNNNKAILCENIKLVNGGKSGFRVNVDGESLSSASNWCVNDVMVRKKDSIRVFVGITASKNQQQYPCNTTDKMLFKLNNGVEQEVVLTAYTLGADATVGDEDHVTAGTNN